MWDIRKQTTYLDIDYKSMALESFYSGVDMISFAIMKDRIGFWVEIETREARTDPNRPVKKLW